MNRHFLKVLLAISCLLFLFAETVSLAKALNMETIAVRISLDEIQIGDRILLTYDDLHYAMGRYASNRMLAPIHIEPVVRNEEEIFTSISPDVAILTVETNADGHLLLHGSDGYLTSGEKGNQLYFSQEITQTACWEIEEGRFLRNCGAQTKSGTQGCYLQCYNGFTTYDKKPDADTSAFVMGCFRLTEDFAAQPTGYVLPVFETSDVHGTIVDISNEPYQYRMAFIADKAKDARTVDENYDPDNAILLDSGDIYQGYALSAFLNGSPVSHAYDVMDYDAIGLGNHEFDSGVENSADFDGTTIDYTIGDDRKINDIPVICANMFKDDEKIPFAQDYVILEKEARNAEGESLEVRIGVIGFVDEYSSDIIFSQFKGQNYRIEYEASIAEEIAVMLENDYGCDATILLIHGNSRQIAQKLGDTTRIDLVLGGHTHQTFCGETEWGLSYGQPANQAQVYVSAQLVFDQQADKTAALRDVNALQTVNITNQPGLLHDTAENADELDAQVLNLSRDAVKKLNEEFNQEIGYITQNIFKDETIDGNPRSTMAANWIADLYARTVDAQVAFVNKGGVRAEYLLPEGADRKGISVADIYQMMPFGNEIYCFEISYADLLEILESSLGDMEGLFTYLTGIDCYYTENGVDALALNDIVIYVDGKWTEGWQNKKVCVAVSNYIVTAENGYNPFNQLKDSNCVIRTIPVDYEAAIEVLRNEAALNEGLLYVDEKPHLIQNHKLS